MKRAAALLILAVLTLPIAFGCCLCGSSAPPAKYAVLASTRMVTPGGDVANSIDFWHDLVLSYCTLIENGFDPDNIFVLYGDGQDFSSPYDAYSESYCNENVSRITDISLTNPSGYDKGNLCNVICCASTGRPAEFVGRNCECKTSGSGGIGGFSCSDPDPAVPRLREQDFLITWIKGHGSTTDCKTSMTFSSGSNITDEELAGLFEESRPRRSVLFFETCDAGGWLDNFGVSGKSVVVTSSGLGGADDCVESSYQATYDLLNNTTGETDLVLHGRFSYWMNAALRQSDLMNVELRSDADENNLVSIQEDFDAAYTKITAENAMSVTEFGGNMFPAIATPDDIASCIFIRLPVPGKDDDVFSMDHPGDDGTVPSAISSPSPDLWVRHRNDGRLQHQPPKTPSSNFIHARVHNIGCAGPGEVKVNFFWASSGSPDEWNFIGDASVQTPPVGKPATASLQWKIEDEPNEDEGSCWLIATLSAGDDQPLDGRNVDADNNKVRIQTVLIEP